MDDLRLRSKSLDLAGHPVVEPGTDGDDQVRIVDRHIGIVGPVHPKHTERKRMRTREPADTHERMSYRNSCDLGKLTDLRRGIREDDPSADIGHWFFCLC